MTDERFEAGYAKKYSIISSYAFDSAPSMAIFDKAGTLVSSYTAVQSSTSQYYVNVVMPNTLGWYYREVVYWQNSAQKVDRSVLEVIQTLAIETTGLYCNANDVRDLYNPLSTGDDRNLEIDQFISDVMSEIDSKIGGRYSVPFGANSVPAVIETITKNLTLVKLVKRRGGSSVPEWIKDDETKYNDMLDAIAVGSIFLVMSGTVLAPSVPTGIGQVDHNMSDYVPTFNMLDTETQRIDPDRLDDEEDAL